jgi:hypothetical protein
VTDWHKEMSKIMVITRTTILFTMLPANDALPNPIAKSTAELNLLPANELVNKTVRNQAVTAVTNEVNTQTWKSGTGTGTSTCGTCFWSGAKWGLRKKSAKPWKGGYKPYFYFFSTRTACESTRCQLCTECMTLEPSNDCFPSASMVFLQSSNALGGSWVRMSSLRRGDRIAAVNKWGKVAFDQVAFSSLADSGSLDQSFLRLETSGQIELTVTTGHHLPVGPRCCATLKVAGDLHIGDTIWVYNGKDVASVPTAQTLLAIETVRADGLHSPTLVGGGFPIVDGIVTAFGPIEDVRAAALVYPVLDPVLTALGLSHTGAWVDNLYECAMAKTKHLWAGNSFASAPVCPMRAFIEGHATQFELVLHTAIAPLMTIGKLGFLESGMLLGKLF